MMTCSICGFETPFPHDHKADNSGIDDGPDLHPPRKQAAPKPPSVTAEIRARSVIIPAQACLNLAAAVNVVLYDRVAKTLRARREIARKEMAA